MLTLKPSALEVPDATFEVINGNDDCLLLTAGMEESCSQAEGHGFCLVWLMY